jgi:hypothetical protein
LPIPKRFLRLAALICSAAFALWADAGITRSPAGWKLANGDIAFTLSRAGDEVRVESLRRTGGPEWAVAGSRLSAFLEGQAIGALRLVADETTDFGGGAKQLALRFQSGTGGLLSLLLRIYPSGAAIEFAAELENKGERTLPLLFRIDPLSLTLKTPLKPYSSIRDKHGFYLAGTLAAAREFKDWLVLENAEAGESALIGGEIGAGILDWRANTRPLASGVLVRAGNVFRHDRKTSPAPAYEIQPGQKIETPIAFLALAKGDPDNAGNEAFHYLKRYVFPKPLANTPLATYCIWLTHAHVEEALDKELAFAQRAGFDVFYHDATWFDGASVVPGNNNWSQGLGSYRESREKFPSGLKALSDKVRAAGLKFGIWVDPGNVDARRVESGEIPQDWLAMIDGKPLTTEHPSLTPMRQLCLGNPQVIDYVEKQLSGIIDQWNIEWVKWDPSGTVSFACDRTDHGHGSRDGAYASYRGKIEILGYLMRRYPQLLGFEVDPSLHYARTNPGPPDLLPGGYTDEFITGPMVSPYVWGSFAAVGKSDTHNEHLSGRWYSHSALDYHIRKHLTHGISFGNINGMASQLLSAAPAGYIEAFQRNMLYFRQYRHLLLEDVYHPKLSAAQGWSAIQYVTGDAAESVVFVFRDQSEKAQSKVYLRGIDGNAKYKVASLNEQPGYERVIAGSVLMKDGLSVKLPNEWLAKGDSLPPGAEFREQLEYGSDILMLQRVP